MTTTAKHWMLLAALAGATLASSLHAQTTSTSTHSHTGSGSYSVTTSNGITRVSSGGAGEDPQVKDDLFAGTEQFSKNATDVTEINMGPDNLGMVGGRHSSEARNMILNIVRTYSYDKPGLYDAAAVEQFRNKLNSGDWHCSVHTRNMKTGESTDVCAKSRNDGIREDAIITIEPKELTFIHRITRVSTSEGGHSEVFYGPIPGVSGLAQMALNDPDNFVDMLLAEHGMMMNQMQGMIDLKVDMLRTLTDSTLASVRPFTIEQLDGLSRNLTIHVKPQPNFQVHVEPGPAAAPEPLTIFVAPPAPEPPPAPAASAAKPLE